MKQLFYLGLSILIGNPLFAQVDYILTDDSLYISDPSNADTIRILNSTQSTADSGLKVSFWIHGIAGNQNSWGVVAAATENQHPNLIGLYPERNTIKYVLKYDNWEDANFGLDNISIEMARDMSAMLYSTQLDSLDESENIAIAHSQGGLVGRNIRYKTETDYRYNESYGALATFGSPHQGAFICNSTVTNGEAQKWLIEGCKALTTAEFNTFKDSKWWLSALISSTAINSFTTSSCDGLGRTVLPTLLYRIRKPVGEDYKIGAPHLAKLDSFARIDSMPVVTFYGVEEEPVLWRVAHSLTNTTSDTTSSSSILFHNPFGLNDDDGMGRFVNQKIASYDAKKREKLGQVHNNLNASLTIFNLSFGLHPLSYYLFCQAKERYREYHSYKVAEEWLVTANPVWKRLIGARRDTSFIDGYVCECMQWGPSGLQINSSIIQNPSDCQQNNLSSNCTLHPRIRHQITEEESDGVVIKSSQRNYPGWKFGDKKMTNTNHMQERNCTETMLRLNELFNGDYGPEFKLGRK